MPAAPAGRDGTGQAGGEQEFAHLGERLIERFWHHSILPRPGIRPRPLCTAAPVTRDAGLWTRVFHR
ncbi:hypothetical protein Ate01nite_22400 [Actinoplanes teichomyceticus]|nr:hypothetical protein Ate01nite_22400 [Actinoplanes teichomyceticus]